MATGTRIVGDFCWINMLTPQPDAAREFFGQLLGWTYFEMPGMGHGIRVDGHDIGGLFDLAGPNTPPGTPPVIGVMVKVDSADAVSERATALGGRGEPAFDVGDAGRMAVLYDPNGANIDVWEPRGMTGTEVDPSAIGAPSWFETMTTDVDKAVAFYGGLFGWTPEGMPSSAGEYTSFKVGDAYVGGVMAFPDALRPAVESGEIRPHWATYFTVADADAAAARAAELGGTVVVPPQDVPGIGRFACLMSPQGVMFYVMAYTHAT